jgi:hypothetical protein
LKPVALFIRSSSLASERSFGSIGGQFAIARICELRGSTTIAVAPFGRYVSPTRASACSVFCWITGSSVSWMSSPSLVSCTVSIRIGSPSASLTIRRSPSSPPSTDSSPCSSPIKPWFSEPTAPITWPAISPWG